MKSISAQMNESFGVDVHDPCESGMSKPTESRVIKLVDLIKRGPQLCSSITN